MKQVVFSKDAPRPVGPYSQAIISDKLVFCSGQLGIDPAIGRIVNGGLEAEAKQCLLNLERVLASIGLMPEDVVKTTVFVTSLEDLKLVNDVYAHHFKEAPPARSIVEVRSLPLKGKIMIEAIAEMKER